MANSCNQNPVGTCSEAGGTQTTANGKASHAEGVNTTANGNGSHVEGSRSMAGGNASHAEGYSNQTTADAAHAEGSTTTASGVASHAEGYVTIASGNSSHSEGSNTTAGGAAAHAEGFETHASAEASHAEGENTVASLTAAHAEGSATTASGMAAHAEGLITTASEEAAHAEGFFTTASNAHSHAEGHVTTSSGTGAHAEGQFTVASGPAAHAEGGTTIAQGIASHAEGLGTQSLADQSHAEGFFTTVDAAHTGAHIMGRFGDTEEPFSWFIANGTSFADRRVGAKWLASDSSMYVEGAFIPAGQDYAEMFETVDGNSIDVGYFVALEGEKIRKATGKDTFFLGVTSSTPGIIGDSGEMHWRKKYVTDEWGRIQKHAVNVPVVKDPDGNDLCPERTEVQPIINPEWDPNQKYRSRQDRTEWVVVGLLGKILVRDDGTCEINGYCQPNDEGVATKSDQGCRVLKRTGPNQILALVTPVWNTAITKVEQLERLARLTEQGFLTNEEFQMEKQKLLNS